jgi:hypothetical protein
MSDQPYAFFRVVQSYLERAARVVDLSPDVAALLSQPRTELIVHFPATASSTTTCSARSRAASATTRT